MDTPRQVEISVVWHEVQRFDHAIGLGKLSWTFPAALKGEAGTLSHPHPVVQVAGEFVAARCCGVQVGQQAVHRRWDLG